MLRFEENLIENLELYGIYFVRARGTRGAPFKRRLCIGRLPEFVSWEPLSRWDQEVESLTLLRLARQNDRHTAAPLAEVHPTSGPGALVVLLVFIVFLRVSLILIACPCISEGFQSLPVVLLTVA